MALPPTTRSRSCVHSEPYTVALPIMSVTCTLVFPRTRISPLKLRSPWMVRSPSTIMMPAPLEFPLALIVTPSVFVFTAGSQPGASRTTMASCYRRRPMPTAVLRRSVAQLFMIGLPGPTLDRATRAFLAEHPPGGVVLFKRNIRSAAQLRRLAEAIHAGGSGVRPLVALDHEGGRVDRLPRPFTHFPPAAVVGARRDPRLAEAVGRAMGRELRAVGIDLDFAPVLDVWSNPRNRVIGDRAFGTDPARLACGKHFPGHGASAGDSHFVLPRVRRSRRALAALELVPFVRAVAAGIPALMTAHVVYPALDPRRPAAP